VAALDDAELDEGGRLAVAAMEKAERAVIL